MKTVKSYISGLAAAMTLSAGFAACQDDFDAPAVEVPVAVNQANTTIAELKAAFWQDAANYADNVGTRDDGSHYIIKGRVVSSDEQSNVFKNISIQDETGAITFSVNSYNLYLNYRRGQEIVVDATGMYIGKYAGLQQFGTPSYYENGSTWQVGFMSPEFFQLHTELNRMPEVGKIDTLVVNSFSELDTAPEGLRKWQSQIVRFNNVHFQDGGVKTFSAYHSNANDDVDRTLVDADGNSNVVVRTSGYATFWNKKLPEGSGDVVGILSFYQSLSGSSTWQLILNDYEGCMNFGNPTIAPGSEDNPYTVADVVKLEQDGTPASGWVSGYIVGSVGADMNGDGIADADEIVWGAETSMPYTLVIGADKETNSLDNALIIELPANTPFRQYGNLRDNPSNYGKAISVRGTFAKVMGTYGVAGNSGASSQFKIEGVDTGSGSVPEGDGTENSPYNAAQAKAKAIENGTASTENVYVKGYITAGAINMTYGTGTWTIANNPEGTGETFELYGTYNTDNGKFTDENAVKIGDLVVAVGPIYNYNGNTPEMSRGHLVSINAGGSETPTPSAGNAIYSESFESSLGQFTSTVETSGTWGGWRWNTNTPACAIANSYVGGNNEAATSWLISPAIDLSGATTASVKLEQAFGFYFPTVQESFCTLNIRENGGEWKQLTLTEFPAKGTGNWTSFAENTVDISAYADKTVEIGFKYVNDGAQSIAWEIRNFSVIADAGSVNPGGGDEPGDDDPGNDPAAAGTGTEDDPYNCAKVIALNPTSKDTALETGKWVKAYIIGYMPSNNTKPANTITTAEGCEVKTNLVVAPTPDEKDFTKCLPVQLPTETNAPGIRTALNLADNPGNLGKEILLKGDVILYCGAPGIKNTSAYKFVE